MYNIDIEEFQGPLELLNHLIEKNKINIYDIPIAEITDQYIEYIESMKDLNLEVTSEFIVIASNLLEIKSKMLLPKVVEEEDPREELVNKILEYRKFKLASVQIGERHERYSKVYYKLKDDLDFIAQDYTLDFDIDLLVKSYNKAMNRFEKRNLSKENIESKNLIEDIERDEFSVEEGMIYIAKKMKDRKVVKFQSVFDEQTTKYRIVTVFMALLELIKRKDIKVVQEEIFGEIVLYSLS